ncbi:DUF6090 family protein [Paraglaciecola hydrolytica]|uniref:Uncharacterized protein n=1 Tax=Paraglaciecola hydrolytica TaxID=1799789 RepID=A0A135ZZP7_9ALTE|nr:DUF6090 family protein [Paraglaciecola hydrolytica]KXI28413.1 hypothetical protein AX660_15025 [Paraglaciecola hydrolytica]
MIKFFRRIRQRMIKESRFSKYLFYAIGEIVLVVIGILIALQINNWNEQRKVDTEIVKVLKEIRTNLITDNLQIQQTYKLKAEDIRIQSVLIEALESGNIPYDSIEYHMGRVMIVRRIVLVDNGYQLMKKFGLERIKDEVFRNALINYYTVSVKGIYDDTLDDDLEFQTVFLPYVRNHFLDWSWGKYGHLANYEQIKEDHYFLTSLKINRMNQESTVQALERGASDIQELIPILDKTIMEYDQGI